MKVVKVEDVENKFAEQRKRFDAAHSLAMEKNKYCDQKILIAAQIVKLMVDDVLDDTKGLIIEHSFDTFDNTKSEQKASRFNDYQKDALRTASPESTKADMDNNMIMLVNGVMGLNGESGEVVDIYNLIYESIKDLTAIVLKEETLDDVGITEAKKKEACRRHGRILSCAAPCMQ